MIEEDIINCKWLSPIITLDVYNNNWEKYNNKLYEIFIKDFIDNKLYFNKKHNKYVRKSMAYLIK